MDAEELGAQARANTGMTLTASLRQVVGVDRGARIAGGQDVMHTVARRAIGGGEVATLQGQPVEALDVRREHIRRQPVLRDDALRGMTLATRFRDVGRRNSGRGQLDRLDCVLAVAIGADGRVAQTLGHRCAVDAS